MKVIIAGSRYIDPVNKVIFSDYEQIKDAVQKSGFIITEVVSGCAKGVDTLGERWATENKIKIQQFPVEWRSGGIYRADSGHKRNIEMANYIAPDGGLIAVWDGKSGGTRQMIQYSKQKGLKVHIHYIRK